jgi:hypothetical protein
MHFYVCTGELLRVQETVNQKCKPRLPCDDVDEDYFSGGEAEQQRQEEDKYNSLPLIVRRGNNEEEANFHRIYRGRQRQVCLPSQVAKTIILREESNRSSSSFSAR